MNEINFTTETLRTQREGGADADVSIQDAKDAKVGLRPDEACFQGAKIDQDAKGAERKIIDLYGDEGRFDKRYRSKLRKMLPEERVELDKWLFEEEKEYAEVRELLKSKFDVHTSKSTICNYYNQRKRHESFVRWSGMEHVMGEISSKRPSEDYMEAGMKVFSINALERAVYHPDDVLGQVRYMRTMIQFRTMQLKYQLKAGCFTTETRRKTDFNNQGAKDTKVGMKTEEACVQDTQGELLQKVTKETKVVEELGVEGSEGAREARNLCNLSNLTNLGSSQFPKDFNRANADEETNGAKVETGGNEQGEQQGEALTQCAVSGANGVCAHLPSAAEEESEEMRAQRLEERIRNRMHKRAKEMKYPGLWLPELSEIIA